MKLTNKQANIMRLIRRSTPKDGWYQVSKQVWPIVEAAQMPKDLVEARLNDGVREVRLTHDGEVVSAYLI